MCRSNTRRHNKSNLSADKFFVVRQHSEKFLARKIFRQLYRQIESLQKIDNCIPLLRRQAGFSYGDRTGRDDSEGDGFAMKKFPIISGALDRVADSMSEIKNRAFTCAVPFVFCNDLRFYSDVATNQRL